MLKTFILASTMLVAAPAFAQEAKPAQTAPATSETAPATDDAAPASTAEPAAPATAQTSPAPAQPATAAAQPAPAETAVATSVDQVAQAVDRDWATYDKNGDSALDKTEFTTWMVTLRKAAEPAFVETSPEAKTWETQAFAAADADKSASINKQELTTFMTPKPS